MISFLVAECGAQGVRIHLDAPVKAIETTEDGVLVHCTTGETHAGDAAILTVPLPILQDIMLPPRVRAQAAMAAKIGFGNVIKLLLHFKHRWWTDYKGKDLSDLLFLLSNETIPVWWTQHPSERPVLTGWLAGPRTERMIHLDQTELVEMGLGSLASLFGRDSKQLKADLVAGRAINWARDPFAGGAYSYATPETRKAQSKLAIPEQGVFLSGEALYRGRDMGTVEAALASGRETARTVLGVD